jgi:F0F1-type ATP synthase membrane subunit b/b'
MTMSPRDGNLGAIGRWWLPILLVAATFFVLMAFETGYALHDREALAEQKRLQEPGVQEALRLRQQLETLAGKTAQLAAEGNENAKTVIDQMKRQGIVLTPPKQ